MQTLNKQFLALPLGVALAITAFNAQAKPTAPRLVASRLQAHCQIPRWSPDGKKIAYDVYEPKSDLREIWIINEDGSAPTEVKTGKSTASGLLGERKAPMVEFCWAPDMTLLNQPYVFSSLGPRKNFDLFADGGWLTDNVGNDGQPDWSKCGRYIAYASQRKASGDVYVIDLQGDGSPIQMTFWNNDTVYRPRFSKQNKLLFTRSESGSRGLGIGVIEDVTRAKETTRMITDWTGDEIRPEWSPDGTKIAFFSNKGNQNDKMFDLWVIGADGKDAKRLARDVVVPDYTGPVWTPDGKAILFVKQDFKRDNPIEYVRLGETGVGVLETGTELNSDLALFSRGDTMTLAFKAIGERGSEDKTWERLYTVSFTMADLGGALSEDKVVTPPPSDVDSETEE